jgi:4-amino-4-deoxychorismate lyase
MSLLVETIRVENGSLNNPELHNDRMMRTIFELFGIKKNINIIDIIYIPDFAYNGLYKCRLEYDTEIRKTDFVRYNQKAVRSLKVVEDNSIDYKYKFIDRQSLEKLLDRRKDCDDVLIVKNGFVTDTSFSNVVLCDTSGIWYTPDTCLLNGTRRSYLLQLDKIRERKIRFRDLENYKELKLINAMIDIEDTEAIPVSNIF